MDIRKGCFKFYWSIMKIIAPSLKYSQDIYEEVLFSYTKNVNRWLDLGCGHKLLCSWRFDQECSLLLRPGMIVGLDYDLNSLSKHKTIKNTVCGDVSRLPFPSGSFDLVTSNMVFEHLHNPEEQLKEIYRILKPKGILIFHTPNVNSYLLFFTKIIPEVWKNKLIWFLERRAEDDVFPTYYKINTEYRIRSIAKSAGFKVEKLRLLVSSAQLVMIPPLVIFELILIRLLMMPSFKRFRTNIIAVLTKP